MSQAQAEKSVGVRPEATLGGFATEFFVKDEFNNRYYYDVSTVVDSFVRTVDGRSIVYFGFATKEQIPESANVDFGNEELIEEDPF